ncbi:MAG: thiamine phosphate synthase [Gaiellaceae bacterium]
MHAIVADLDTARLAVAAGATVVQLRVKAPTPEVVARGRGFAELGVTFVVNDDVDAALELRADGVHLGQGDEGAERARAAGLLLGRSVSSASEAAGIDADYIGAGPVWETPSKEDAEPAIGLEGLRSICAAASVPVVAISGVDATNAGACIEAGAAGVAAIRAATDPGLRRAVDDALGRR